MRPSHSLEQSRADFPYQMGVCLSSRRKPQQLPSPARKRPISQYPPAFSFTSEPFQLPFDSVPHKTAEETEASNTVTETRVDIPPPPPPKDSEPKSQRSDLVDLERGGTTDSSHGGKGISSSGGPLAANIPESDGLSSRSERESAKAGSSRTMVEFENDSDL